MKELGQDWNSEKISLICYTREEEKELAQKLNQVDTVKPQQQKLIQNRIDMCLYPTFTKNPKYKPNKKNNGKPPICRDRRLFYIPIKCGCCIECRKEKQREWRVRLEEELRSNFGYFTAYRDWETKKDKSRKKFKNK